MKSLFIWENYEYLLTKIKNLIRSITNNSDDYDLKYMKIKFTSDDSLLLKKMLELHNMVIIVGSVFREDSKFYLQDFLDEFLYKL